MTDEPPTPRIDDRTVFAAFALHRLLAGMEAPEEHFSQLEDSYSDVCEQAWRISDRMMQVRAAASTAHPRGNPNGPEETAGS